MFQILKFSNLCFRCQNLKNWLIRLEILIHTINNDLRYEDQYI